MRWEHLPRVLPIAPACVAVSGWTRLTMFIRFTHHPTVFITTVAGFTLFMTCSLPNLVAGYSDETGRCRHLLEFSMARRPGRRRSPMSRCEGLGVASCSLYGAVARFAGDQPRNTPRQAPALRCSRLFSFSRAAPPDRQKATRAKGKSRAGPSSRRMRSGGSGSAAEGWRRLGTHSARGWRASENSAQP